MTLAVPTLSIVDNAAGTGAVATIAGATGGTTNTILGASWDGGFIGAAFASLGSRVGNGTLALAVANGYWWAYVSSTLAANDGVVSLVQGFRATSGSNAMFELATDGVKSLISGLTLSGMVPANIMKSKLPHEKVLAGNAAPQTPAVLVCPIDDSNEQINNGQNEWKFDILVTVIASNAKSLTANISRHLLWRQQIADAFLPAGNTGRIALPGVTEINRIEVLMGPVFESGMFREGLDCEQLTIRCFYRRNRGQV